MPTCSNCGLIWNENHFHSQEECIEELRIQLLKQYETARKVKTLIGEAMEVCAFAERNLSRYSGV